MLLPVPKINDVNARIISKELFDETTICDVKKYFPVYIVPV